MLIDVGFNGPQDDAWNAIAPRRTIFLGFGRGVGKSHFMRRAWYLTIAQWEGKQRPGALKPLKGVRIIPLMPTLTQFRDVHGTELESELAPGGEWGFLHGKVDRTRWQVTFPGGSWIKPFPASQYNARTARGMRCDVVSPDEIDDIDGAVYDSVAVPWLSEPWSLGIELMAGTPTRGRHGLWYRTLEAGRIGARLRAGEDVPGIDPEHIPSLKTIFSFHATYRDAPETVSLDAVAKAKATTLPATFKREWEADPDAGEGLVYPFDESFHVRLPPPIGAFSEFIVGMDHGWVDAGVMLLIGIQGHGRDATAWILEEHYESEVPNHIWDERAKNWNFAKFWPDPSRPDRINDLKRVGCRCGETDNDIHGGIARVADMIFRRKQEEEDGGDWARLYVAAGCVNTIRELNTYRRKKHPDGSFGEDPEDKNNHACDALRYALVGRFGKPAAGKREILDYTPRAEWD
jgi:hypothetical protein